MTYHRRGETKTLLQTRDLPRSRVPAWGYIHLSAVRHEGDACRSGCRAWVNVPSWVSRLELTTMRKAAKWQIYCVLRGSITAAVWVAPSQTREQFCWKGVIGMVW
jgi:hypothetical protein